MSAKSILDIEEARRRLQTMEQDHQSLVEVIEKLKKFRAETATAMEQLNERMEETGQCLGRAKQTADGLDNTLEGLRIRSEAVFAHLNDVRDQLLADAEKSLRQFSAAADKLRTDVGEEHTKWCKDQETRREKFEAKHHTDLENVTKAYQRQKVVYDSVATSLETLDVSIGRLKKEVLAEFDAVRAKFEQELACKAEELEEKIESAYALSDSHMTKLGSEFEKKSTKLRESILESRNLAYATRTRLARIATLSTVTTAVVGILSALLIGLIAYEVVRGVSDGVQPQQKVAPRSADKRPSTADATREPHDSRADVAGKRANSPAAFPRSPAPEPRIWTDSTGKSSVEATFVGFSAGSVTLRRTDTGKVVSVPLEKLSPSDQRYVVEKTSGQ